MKILKPDKYDIQIEKKQTNYKMTYYELFLKERENLKEALDTTYEIAKNYPFKVERINDEKYCGFKISMEDSLDSISDFLAGEFLGMGNLGNVTLAQLFGALGAMAGMNK